MTTSGVQCVGHDLRGVIRVNRVTSPHVAAWLCGHSYIYGPYGLPVEQISSGGTVTYLHHDQQGSTRLLIGSTDL